MKARRRIRGRPARVPPAIRRGGARAAGLMVGGAKDPAETNADARAAQALGPSGAAPLRRSAAPGAALAPGAAPAPAPRAAETAIGALGAGRPLSPATRAFYEPRLGADLSRVRLHEDAAADRAAEAMDASAFTLGPDIAFARDALATDGPALVAHELAHTAEEGDTVRRTIKVDAPTQPLADHLHDYYGANDIVYADTTLSSPFRRDEGELAGQVVQNMLASDRVFEIDGSGPDETKARLDDHVIARVEIKHMARSMRVTYDPTQETLDPTHWPEFKADADKRLATYRLFLKFQDMDEDQIKREVAVARPQVYFDMFNKNVDHQKYDGIFDELIAHNREHEWTKDKSNPDPDRYHMGCFLAALLVVFGGARGKLRQEQIETLGAVEEDETRKSWTDWIPGDLGFIESIYFDQRIPESGREGLNIVSYGDDLFWANVSEKNEVASLKTAFDTACEPPADGAEVKPLRVYPEAGLK